MAEPTITDIYNETKSGLAAISDKQAKLEKALEEYKLKIDGHDALVKKVDELQTKLNRPHIPVESKDSKGKEMTPERKAFINYLRYDMKGVAPEEQKLLSTVADPTGGYLVPTQLRNQIIELINDLSPVRRYASVLTISVGNTLEIPTENAGTFAAGWVGEEAARAATATLTFGKLTIPVHEMYAKPQATQTMLDDAMIDVEAYVARKVAERLAILEGTAFVNGTGVGQPSGLLINAGGAVANVNSGAAATYNNTDCFIDAMYTLRDQFSRNGVWFMRRATKPILYKLKDGTGNYIFQRAVTADVPDLLLGKPIVEVPDMPAVAGDAYAILFGDIAQSYQIVDKSTVGMLRDPYSSKPYVEYYTTKRTGGAPSRTDSYVTVRCHV